MALPATDDFTTGSDQTLTDYSANWTANVNNINVLAATDDIVADVVNNDVGIAHWNADSFDNDQYCELDITSVDSFISLGPMVRVHASAHTGYLFESSSEGSFFYKVVATSYTQLGSDTGAASPTERYQIEANGTTIRSLVDDVEEDSQTDSSISSGSAGIHSYQFPSSTTKADNWEGGNLAAGGDSIPYLSGLRRRRFQPQIVR